MYSVSTSNTVRAAVLESVSYNESYFRNKNNTFFLEEFKSPRKVYNGLVRLQDEDCFIDVFSRLEDKHRMNSSNLISVYYISDEINAPMEVEFNESISFVISVIPNSG